MYKNFINKNNLKKSLKQMELLTQKRSRGGGQNKRLICGVCATVFIAVALIFYACNKDSDILKIHKNSSNIRAFSNMEELHNEVELVNSMNEEELENYENSINFLSYGRHAESIYSAILEECPCDNMTIAQLDNYIAEYPQYLELKTNEEGENEFLIKYEDSPFNYIMNDDRMFQVGNNIYRVFEWVVLEANFENIDLLLNVTEEDLKERAEEIIELFFNDDTEEELDKISKKGNQKYLDPSLPLRPRYVSGSATKSIGGGTVVGGGPNPPGPGGGGSGGGTTPTSNYGWCQELYSLIHTSPNGHQERVKTKFWIEIEKDSGTKYPRGYALVRGQWRCSPNACWTIAKRTLSVDLTMEMYVNGTMRSGSLNFTLGSPAYKIEQIIVPDRGSTYNGNSSQYYITKINGQACIPTICCYPNLN